MSLDILAVGMATMDRLYLLRDCSELPSGTVLDYSVQGGGPAATAIAAASVLGASCGMIAAVGDDETGRQILAGLRECGVDTSRSVIKNGLASPVVLVLVDARTGDRHFLGHHADHALVGVDDVDWDYAAGARIIHFDSWIREAPAALQKARALGATVTVDANIVPGLEPGWVYRRPNRSGRSAPIRRSSPSGRRAAWGSGPKDRSACLASGWTWWTPPAPATCSTEPMRTA